MKIMVMTDMEGSAGILNHDDWVLPTGRFYDKGQRLLTMEVNAACQGLFTGGAKEIVVADGHGAGGIDPELLNPRVKLLRGWGPAPYPFGLDASFDGFAVVGQHAKAGTPFSHITHTGWFNYIDVSINGFSVGEYGQLALCAMELGVPCILACGEEAFTREAEAFTPGVITASVKTGTLPDGLDALDQFEYRKAKLGALHLSPDKARQAIRAAALKAARKLATRPRLFKFPDIGAPYTMISRVRREGELPARTLKREHPSSVIELLNMR
jgi:D-amino peptidase